MKLDRGTLAFWAAVAAVPVICVGLMNLERASRDAGERVDYYTPEQVAARDAYNRARADAVADWNARCITSFVVRDECLDYTLP